MPLKNKQSFKKYIFLPLLKNIREDFLSKKDNSEKIYRFETEIENPGIDFDPAQWLLSQDNQIKTYWSDRDKNFLIAGIDYADIFSDGLNSNLNTGYFIRDIFQIIKSRISNAVKPVKYFGCLAFDMEDRIDALWESFGKVYFVLPRVELCKINKKFYFAANIFYNPQLSVSKKEYYEEICEFLGKIQPEANTPREKKIRFSNRNDYPEKDKWKKNINQAVSSFEFEKINKIVLSRKSVFKLQEITDPVLMLLMLKKINIETYDFCFQNGKNNAFTGCTPELLFSRSDGKIYSEAVAGTIPKGRNSVEEKAFGEDLLKSRKDSDEYKVVFNSVKSDLEKISSNVKVIRKKELLKLSYAQHIYSQFEGNLKPDIDDYKIISTLHPTPAVSGYPKQNIKAIIKRYETFFRGFYAGPTGWIGKNGSEFVVGIRSGIINNGNLSIYSGAGIVKKSSPELEWNEIENKISPFLKILQSR
ncbi:MAG: isochorismate synthase [Actinobacteria bacterium]|nr:isochorismate synthase [Actinomycetota bacterium]